MELPELKDEIIKRFESVEKISTLDFSSLGHQEKQFHSDAEYELILKDNEEFEQARLVMAEEVGKHN
jgi:hypothetical protein